MDAFDNNSQPVNETPVQPPVPPQQVPPQQVPPQDQGYSQTGWYQQPYSQTPPVYGSQKRSPFADSPYTTNVPPHNGPQYGYPPQQQKPPKKKSGAGRRILSGFLTILLVAGSCGATAYGINYVWEQRIRAMESGYQQELAELRTQINGLTQRSDAADSAVSVSGGMTPGQVYAQNVDSVVAISASSKVTNFYGQTSEAASSGSGFILTDDGYVITNYHVVEGATSIKVLLNNGEEYPAKMVGKDATNDVAVLKAEATGLPAVVIGSSEDLLIGDMVVAIGNPLGELNATQTVGYVSGKNREVTTDNTVISMIQTDAAINPGNSGGPLFNMNGEVVGITTAKYSGTTNSGASIEGIGFAIPIDDVLTIIDDLKNLGYVSGAYLGVTVQDMDSTASSQYGLPMGAYVVEVVSGGSADKAGVQPKDIIVKIGEYEVGSVTELTRNLRKFEAGDETTLVVFRGGQELELPILLDERPSNLDSTPTVTNPTETMPQEGSYEDWYNYFAPFFGSPIG